MLLDASTSAYFTRLNEVAIVCCYHSTSDPSAAQIAAEAVRSALIDACGGKPADVTITALSTRGLQVQLTARRAMCGFGRISGVSHPKFDIATVQISPDAAVDDKNAAEVRASNDPIAPGALAAALDAAASMARKGDSLGEALKALKLPLQAPAASRQPRVCRRASLASALLHLLPAEDSSAKPADEPEASPQLSPATRGAAARVAPAWAKRVGFGYDDDDASSGRHSASVSDSDDDGDASIERGSSVDDDGDGGGDSEEDDEEKESGSVDEDQAAFQPPKRASVAGISSNKLSQARDGSDVVFTAPAPAAASPVLPAGALQAHLGEFSVPASGPSTASRDLDLGNAVGTPSAPRSREPEPGPATIPLRLAFLHSESVTLTGKLGGAETVVVEGTLLLKGSPSEPLPPSLLERGHGPLAVAVRMRAAAPFASVTYTPPQAAASASAGGAAPTAQDVPLTSSGSADGSVEVTLTVPPRPRGVPSPAGGPPASPTREQLDLGSIHYRLAPGFAPQVIKAQASCKYTFALAAPSPVAGPGASEPGALPHAAEAAKGASEDAPAESAPTADAPSPQPQQQYVHRFTDVLLKAVVHPAAQAVTGAQLLVQLPTPGLKPQPGGEPPPAHAAYEAPQFKPAAQWNAGRAQMLWAVADAPAGPADAALATSASFLVPGKPCEFKARVPVSHGLAVADPAPYAPIAALPLQVRLTLPGSVLGPVALEPLTTDAPQPQSVSGSQVPEAVSVKIVGVVAKAQSRLTATYK